MTTKADRHPKGVESPLRAATGDEINDEMAGLLTFREVFGTLHEDHEEYTGPTA